MSESAETLVPHVRFALGQPPSHPNLIGCPADAFTLTSHDSFPFEDPPSWAPLFEDVSCLPSSPPLRGRRPLDPPPSCFSTPSPLRIKSHDFPPFYIPSVGDRLMDGFRMLYPRGILEKHGLNSADWVRFLEDLKVAARLSTEGLSAVRSRAPITPFFAHRIFPSRILGAVYDGRFARSPVGEVRALIQIWNQCAFERRKVSVTLQIRQIRTSEQRSYALVVESL